MLQSYFYKILNLLGFAIILSSCQLSDSITLTSNKNSNYKIILSDSASSFDSLAASELQYYFNEISDVILPIISDNEEKTGNEIIVGLNKHSETIDTMSIKFDGYIIKTIGSDLFILGKNKKGTLNGVYSFLEKYLNCRMYSLDVKIIPKQSSIVIPIIDLVENPIFPYREIYSYESTFNDYSLWNKIITKEDKKTWGLFVHTFETLLPAKEYFEEHPEYFAKRGNIRVREQICLSNPKVYEIVLENLSSKIEKNQEAKIWSVSQNDNYSYCQCSECSKVDKETGSPSGSIINFVNKIAKEFPDKIISTLAYQYSRKAPRNIKLAENVNIMLCTIECFRTEPIENDKSNSGFVNDLKEWSELTSNIFLWDYVVQFTNLISPFPNLQVLQPNLKLFANHGAKMMFQQGAGKRSLSEFGELKSYLISKLLWNPNINIDSVMNDFLLGYYGNAGTHIKTYIDLMKSELLKSEVQLNIYGNPVEALENYLSPSLMKKYNIIFDKAEEAVANSDEHLQRVKLTRLPLIYAMLEQSKISKAENNLVIKHDDNLLPNPQIVSELNKFNSITKNHPNVYLNEKGLTPEKYYSRFNSILSKSVKKSLAHDKKIKFNTSASSKYPRKGEAKLSDGKYGDEDHYFNWLGFEGNDMEIIIDLEKIINVKRVSADFLQNSFSWIFLPKFFEVSCSINGKEYLKITKLENSNKITREETTSPEFAFIKSFSVDFEQVDARYIKVKASNINICPRWHPGYPGKAWIFTDEIVVE